MSIRQTHTYSAQRLSASLESSPLGIAPAPFPVAVLNAFRHHWNLHTRYACLRTTTPDVLNAFRHHWNLHLRPRSRVSEDTDACSTPFGIIGIFTRMLSSRSNRWKRCSTPFGIIGIFTAGLPSPRYRPCSIVLTAFRHH